MGLAYLGKEKKGNLITLLQCLKVYKYIMVTSCFLSSSKTTRGQVLTLHRSNREMLLGGGDKKIKW